MTRNLSRNTGMALCSCHSLFVFFKVTFGILHGGHFWARTGAGLILFARVEVVAQVLDPVLAHI